MTADTALADAPGSPLPRPPAARWRRLLAWAASSNVSDTVAILLLIAALASGVATYGALTRTPPFGSDPATVQALLTLDIVLLLLFGAVIARRIVALWIIRRRGQAGSRLHVRLVAIFSLLAVTPAILMALFSSGFFYFGVQSWFSEQVRTAVEESREVARAYLVEHQQTILADTLAMANDIDREAEAVVARPERLARLVQTQALLRNLTEAVVVVIRDGHSQIVARAGLTFLPWQLQVDPLQPDTLAQARAGDVVLLDAEGEDRVRALVALRRIPDTYLVVGRLVEARVLRHVETAEDAARSYAELEGRRSDFQVTVTLVFLVVALLLLLAAVWIGLLFARHLVDPVSQLITAAERVRAGDLQARVPERLDDDELGVLSRAFNRMTSQLDSQRSELIQANRQLDARRQFIETVLARVSAGVFGVDRDGTITVANHTALDLLSGDDPERRAALVGSRLEEAVPEMVDLVAEVRGRHSRVAEAQIDLRRDGEPRRTLRARAGILADDDRAAGTVVTFDDVTELQSAQRMAAWADVARRIAHEIKNPLTPIQLSAERLKRRYLKQIADDAETFSICTDTIVRSVGDIGRMIDEFSAFARMPRPVFETQALGPLVDQAVFLQRQAHPEITFTIERPPEPVMARCDARQVAQVLTNLLQNAADAIEGRPQPDDGASLPAGTVQVILAEGAEAVRITVEDNGRGLPEEDRARLIEPYVTTRARGTGLGLAIVAKILEDHGGALELGDRAGGGASVAMSLPRVVAAAVPAAEPDRYRSSLTATAL